MKSVFENYESEAWPIRFTGTIRVGTLRAGIPANPKVAEAWLKSKVGVNDEAIIQQMVANIMLDQKVKMDEAVEIANAQRNLNRFRSDPELYIEGRQLKAALKEAVSVAVAAGKLKQRGWGETKKFVTSFFPEHVFVEETKLYLGRTEPDGVAQDFPHTRFGSSIAYTEYCCDVDIHFTIVTDWDFGDKDWAQIWLTGQRQGIGASRSQGYGTYVVTQWDRQTVRPTKRTRPILSVVGDEKG